MAETIPCATTKPHDLRWRFSLPKWLLDRLIMSDDRLCLKCGYALQGLSGQLCPECGRPFDLTDPRTFDTPMRRVRRRRRRWILLAAFLLGLIVIAPRRFLRGEIVFTCTTCGLTETVKRLEPAAPGWLPLRYPGFSWRRKMMTPPTQGADTASATALAPSPCAEHPWFIRVTSEFPAGRVTGTVYVAIGTEAYVIDQRTTPETAPHVLKELSAPTNFGIDLTTKPKAP